MSLNKIISARLGVIGTRRFSFITSLFLLSYGGYGVAHEIPHVHEGEEAGEPQQFQQMFDLELEDLLNVKVSVASKTAFLPQDAPGIVTVYTRQDLDETGYNTLADLADITPGYSSYSIYGERVFETRGQKAGSYDNHKHLLLIDGIPVAHARANKVITEEELPLYFADSVEFLRGPGSALYGTSAYFGVVSIKPKERWEYGAESEFNVALGNHDSDKRFMANLYQTEPEARLSMNVGYYDKNPSKDPIGQIDDPLYVNFDDQKSTFFRYKFELTDGALDGLDTGAIYMETRGGLGEFWTHTPISHEINDITWETLVPYVRFKRELNKNLHLTSFLKYNRSEQFGVTLLVNRENFDDFDAGDRPLLVYDVIIEDWEANVETQYDFNDDRNLILGLNYDTRKQDNESFFYNINTPDGIVPAVSDFNPDSPTDRINTYSAYTQYQDRFPILDGLLVTAGVRYDEGDSKASEYENWSPRVAVVQKLDQNWNVKFLAGQALRSPGLKETGLNQEIIQSQATNNITVNAPPIEPEIIKSYEIGLTYNDEDTLASLTLFTNETTDTIGRVQVPNAPTGVAIYENISDEIDAKGVEVELKQVLSSRWRLFANYSYADSEDSDGVEITDVPYGKANFGITYLGDKNTYNLIVRHVEGYQVSDNTSFDDTGAFEVVDFNFTHQLTRSAKLGIQVRNLFDEEYFLPKTSVNYGFTTEDLGDVPIPSRHVLFSLNVDM